MNGNRAVDHNLMTAPQHLPPEEPHPPGVIPPTLPRQHAVPRRRQPPAHLLALHTRIGHHRQHALSKNVVLAEVPHPAPGCAWEPVSTEIVAAINRELFTNANEFVFAGREQFTGHESMTSRRDASSAGGPA